MEASSRPYIVKNPLKKLKISLMKISLNFLNSFSLMLQKGKTPFQDSLKLIQVFPFFGSTAGCRSVFNYTVSFLGLWFLRPSLDVELFLCRT